MSYDVNVGLENFNYTFNTSKLFYDIIPDRGKGGGLRELAGITGKEAVVILSDAFKEMERIRLKLWIDDAVGEPRMTSKYDSSNGWGSTIGAILFLGNIMAECAKNPDEIVEVGI